MNQPSPQAFRLSDAVSHVDQANTIFNYVLFALQAFLSTGDPTWDHRLAASANVSQLVHGDPTADSETIVLASREIAFRRLPRLLCAELVTAVETCFQDLCEIHVRAAQPNATDEEVSRAVNRMNAGGPIQYLPRLAQALGLPPLETVDWDWFKELVATRNVLVHLPEPIADARYVANAGPQARGVVGQSVDVDNGYLLRRYNEASGSLMALLRFV
jgi:hypothetical protein